MPQYSKRTELHLIDGLQERCVMFDFTCEGCGCFGDLAIPLNDNRPIVCPGGCGARYILWKSFADRFALTCVVCPVFEESESGDDD